DEFARRTPKKLQLFAVGQRDLTALAGAAADERRIGRGDDRRRVRVRFLAQKSSIGQYNLHFAGKQFDLHDRRLPFLEDELARLKRKISALDDQRVLAG